MGTIEENPKAMQKRFSTTEICRIIKLCRKNEVSEMKLGDFHVFFHEKETKQVKNLSRADRKSDLPQTQENFVTATRSGAAEVEKAFGVQDKVTLSELEAAQMLIDDPAAYEAAEIDAAINGQGMVTVNEDERHW